MGHWYCKKCVSEIDPINVTFEEAHENCGYKVEWVEEAVPGMIFNEPQKAYYRLTGRKPLIFTRYNKKSIITANSEYLEYLEKHFDANAPST